MSLGAGRMGVPVKRTHERWWKDEAINLNTVTVPHSWIKKGFLPQADNGLVRMPLTTDDEGWQGEFDDITIHYTREYGLEREIPNDKH